MSETAAFRLDDSRTAAITGDLTLDTVGRIFRECSQATGRGARTFEALDLTGVSRVDSSGLALLLEWQAAFGGQQGKLAIRGAPRDLVRLADLCDARDLLDLNPNGQAETGA